MQVIFRTLFMSETVMKTVKSFKLVGTAGFEPASWVAQDVAG
jgi:hypothetical protein